MPLALFVNVQIDKLFLYKTHGWKHRCKAGKNRWKEIKDHDPALRLSLVASLLLHYPLLVLCHLVVAFIGKSLGLVHPIWLYIIYNIFDYTLWLHHQDLFRFDSPSTHSGHSCPSLHPDTAHFGSAHVPEHWPKLFSPASKGRRWSSWPNSEHYKIRHLILGYSLSCLPIVDEK